MSTTHPPSSPGTGRGPGRAVPGHAVAAGAITFVVVLVLIVGGALGVRALLGGRPDPAAHPAGAGASSTTSTGARAGASTEDSGCWRDETAARTSTNPEGRLRGGGLEFVAPSGFDQRPSTSWAPFTGDAQMAAAAVEGDWVSSFTVAEVTWQDGAGYPGAEAASGRILECMVSDASLWDGTAQRTLEDRSTTAITVDGMRGSRTSGNLMFGTSDLTTTTGTALTVIVVDTPQGPSMFSAEVAIGVPAHEEAEQEAEGSLSGLTS